MESWTKLIKINLCHLNRQLGQLDSTIVDCFAMVCWGIWFECNAVCLKQVSLPYSQIYSDSVARLHEFHLAVDSMVKPAVFSCPNHSDGICFSHFGHLVDNSCAAAASKFRTCFFSHVRRDCNRVAAKLAKTLNFCLRHWFVLRTSLRMSLPLFLMTDFIC